MLTQPNTFQKVLVANRGEIAIRVFRACTELGIRTVAVYSREDRFSLHRYKADEAYLVGQGKEPVAAYLDIDGMVEIALQSGCDAIHPGYGFLSESEPFARACQEAGITFIGPSPDHLDIFGNKVKARQAAVAAGIPVVPGSASTVSFETAAEFAKSIGYPVMLKAASGGGGRGMRVVRTEAELADAYARAASEARKAFGSESIYVEKYISAPKHIEVQILGDSHGNLVHLYERDCSIQRRHQKIVEVAPSRLPDHLRLSICESARQLMAHVGYKNAGTVEFLVGEDGGFYFIEVNPRIQVEHTITELITGIDLVQAQIRVAQGYALNSPEIDIADQAAITTRGFAIQSRITSEDPDNEFFPDTGRITTYRAASGFGIRLDAGNGFAGARISPHYDSLLVKVSAYALTFPMAVQKMTRALQEFRIRGVKTNIPFLSKVMEHPLFVSGHANVNLIEEHPELFHFPRRQDRATKLLRYIGDVTVNGPTGNGPVQKPQLPEANVPSVPSSGELTGSRTLWKELGTDTFLKQIHRDNRLWLTDTTFRDAHQSLLATRMRTRDLARIAPAAAHIGRNLFSMEVWGGATFDASMRFLKEDPWERLALLREMIPNTLFQMLLRGANGVGYKNYPDNVITTFTQRAAEAGIDVFRIFDSLNWLPNMEVAIDAARDAGAIAEAAICYTGDILNPSEVKYTLKYYVDLARQLEQAGAHILCIKDMAGLLKPYAAPKLIEALRGAVTIPIHLHTHDTSGNGVATLMKAAEAGVDIVDVAISSLSGTTSQPSWNAIQAATANTPLDVLDNPDELQSLADYWEGVRAYYARFETGQASSSADVYRHQMPGGQYTNLREQANALGIGDKFPEVKKSYMAVNQLLGDIVKVTPSSKMVGDFALFMVQNNLTEDNLLERASELDFPASVLDYFLGSMGQPYGGFPKELQTAILKGRIPVDGRPGEHLPAVDWPREQTDLAMKIGMEPTDEQVLSYVLYPQVTVEFLKYRAEYGDVSTIDTLTFFYGITPDEEVSVEIEPGKSLIIKLLSIGELQSDGSRTIFFELNGQPRHVEVIDRAAPQPKNLRRKVSGQPTELGAAMPGRVIHIPVHVGETVEKGQLLMVTEAMKMEIQVVAPRNTKITEILCQTGDAVEPGDVLMMFAD